MAEDGKKNMANAAVAPAAQDADGRINLIHRAARLNGDIARSEPVEGTRTGES